MPKAHQLTGTKLKKGKERTNEIDYRAFIEGWKENAMGGTYSTRWSEKRCIQQFSLET
jgi:hypothetical protein